MDGREELDVVIVGAGQAGLSLSHRLTSAGIEHAVLEREQIGHSWSTRWDSFCLVTPNWAVRLPGDVQAVASPDGFLLRDEIVQHLARYAADFHAPVREKVDVTAVTAAPDGGFALTTSAGPVHARQLVLATGGYQRPHRPPVAATLPASLSTMDAVDYTNPAALPPGGVLIVGSGQTGCQIAEELAEAGVNVWLACGRAPWMPRRPEGRDIFAWLEETTFFDTTPADLPDPRMKLWANPQCSGRDGGHDLNYRTLQAMGVTLTGHFLGTEDGALRFADDLADSVAFGDARYRDMRTLITKSCAAEHRQPPELPEPRLFTARPATTLHQDRIGTVLFTTGYRPNFTSWVEFPHAFDALGFPIHQDGSSTIVPGLHFMGVHWQRNRKSATFLGVADDSALVAQHIIWQRPTGSL